MTIAGTTRQMVVDEARTWLWTPFERRAMIKGAGVDCGLLPYAVYRKFDLVPEFEAEWLQYDWFLHTTEERYLLMIERYLRKLIATKATIDAEALPGDLVLARLQGSLTFNHAAIVTKWPRVIHAGMEFVSETDASQDPLLARKEIVIFSIGLSQ